MRVARCVVIRLHANVIEATISCGPYKGEVIILPRIPLIPSDSELPFQFHRLQFPCKPCFSMSINKARHSRPLEWTPLSHVSPMGSYMWLPLGPAAYPNLAYSYPTISRAMWSTQKPCRTEEKVITLLDFFKILFHWQWKSFDIY